MGSICCPETSIRNYHYLLRNSPEERSSHLFRGLSLKSRKARYECHTFCCSSCFIGEINQPVSMTFDYVAKTFNIWRQMDVITFWELSFVISEFIDVQTSGTISVCVRDTRYLANSLFRPQIKNSRTVCLPICMMWCLDKVEISPLHFFIPQHMYDVSQPSYLLSLFVRWIDYLTVN